MLYKVVLTFKSADETLVCDHSNESYWAVLSCGGLFISLYKVVVTFKSADETLVCDHSNESYWAVLSLMWYCFWGCTRWLYVLSLSVKLYSVTRQEIFTACYSFVILLTLITIIIFRGEVINGGFGLVLDGSQVSFVFAEQPSILNAGNNYFPFSNQSETILTSHA